MLTRHSSALSDRYSTSVMLACNGHYDQARDLLREIQQSPQSDESLSLVLNDLAVLDALSGETTEAVAKLQSALNHDPECTSARANVDRLKSLLKPEQGQSERQPQTNGEIRIAIVSLLFNWPSTGGGTVHTFEVAQFLSAAGFKVKHIYARQDEWGLGQVTQQLSIESEQLRFTGGDWNASTIRDRFHDAVERFSPDFVIVTDSWNTKVLLAEAVADYPYFLRIAALEGICPLNNVRLLVNHGEPQQCGENQLARPHNCQKCVADCGGLSGGLHQAERALAEFDQPEYPERLKRAFAQAQAVLVVNPQIADLVRGHCADVRVIPSGFDPQRFAPVLRKPQSHYDGRKRVFFAGLVDEFMKGFAVLYKAAKKLWRERQDFELIVTAESEAQPDPFVRYIGWQTQAQLPSAIAAADMLVFPTLAQEALGRSAVEAMGCARPVVASRLGGLPWVVEDEVTGLLFDAGKVDQLVAKLKRLLDDTALCQRLGEAGREKFLREFTWDAIIETHYRPLLGSRVLTD